MNHLFKKNFQSRRIPLVNILRHHSYQNKDAKNPIQIEMEIKKVTGTSSVMALTDTQKS